MRASASSYSSQRRVRSFRRNRLHIRDLTQKGGKISIIIPIFPIALRRRSINGLWFKRSAHPDRCSPGSIGGSHTNNRFELKNPAKSGFLYANNFFGLPIRSPLVSARPIFSSDFQRSSTALWRKNTEITVRYDCLSKSAVHLGSIGN